MITYQLTLVCDKCGAMLAGEQQSDFDTDPLNTKAWKLGWRFPLTNTRRDLCPDCIAKKPDPSSVALRREEVVGACEEK